MKKLLFIYAFLSLTGYGFLLAQNPTDVVCNSGQFTFSAKKDINYGLMYTVTDKTSQKTDTMLIYPSNVNTCFCNDTLAVFLVGPYPNEIEYFRLRKGGWKWEKTIYLPEGFPLIGILTAHCWQKSTSR